MKLNFNHRGVKLFFITFAVAGRAKVLSRLVDEKSRPELTSLGEAVKALWRHLHGLYPWLGTSDYVIMPDHVHLLLIVDFDRCPKFNPLVFIHWFMTQSERWVNAILGDSAPAPPPGVKELVDLPDFVYCPCDFMYPRGPNGEEHWAAASNGQRRGAPVAQGVRGCPPKFAWEDGFWLDLPMSPAQLKSIRRYIRLNPARALWKARHPDCFIRRAVPREKLVAEGEGLPPVFYAIGDLTILGSPFLFHVRLTLKKTVEEHREAIDEIVEKARRGMIPVSGFISPGEKEALRRLKAEPLARFVKTLPNALPPKYDPSAEDSRELAAHRLVILSGMAETAAISSLDIRRSQAAAHGFRQNCLAMNAIAAALCRQNERGVS